MEKGHVHRFENRTNSRYSRNIHPQTPYNVRSEDRGGNQNDDDSGCAGCLVGCFLSAIAITGMSVFAGYALYEAYRQFVQ